MGRAYLRTLQFLLSPWFKWGWLGLLVGIWLPYVGHISVAVLLFHYAAQELKEVHKKTGIGSVI